MKAEGAAASQSTFNVQPVTEAANTAMGLITVPNEWISAELRLQISWVKSTQNEYVINQAMQANQPFLYFNNLRIVPNAAQTLGDFTLIDSSAAGVFLQKGLTFEFGINDDDFASNSISARAMVRGGVAGFRPNGLTTGTISLVADELETP